MSDFVCHVREGLDEEERADWREACEGLDFYAEREGKPYCVLHYPNEEKDKRFQVELRKKLERQDFNFGGVYFPTYFGDCVSSKLQEKANFSGATFTRLANFSHATFEDGADFSNARFEEMAEFSYARFEGWAEFSGAIFNDVANFPGTTFDIGASFSEANFGWTDFYKAIFKENNSRFIQATFKDWAKFWQAEFQAGVSFNYANFESADFSEATFREGAEFNPATFKQANFTDATFARAYFIDARFQELMYLYRTKFDEVADFRRATFEGEARFFSSGFGPQARVGFESAQIEKPERFSFHTVSLRPNWFIDVDAQEFDFSDVEWFRLPNGEQITLEAEIEALGERYVEPPHSLRKLAECCRKLMNNAEKNRDYSTANEFHYWSMEAERKLSTRSAFTRPLKLIWWYWVLSGYGERHIRAVMWLLGILFGFAALYMWLGPVGVQNVSPIGVLGGAWESIIYSLGVMTRLANGIPKTASTLVASLIVIEGVLGPLQIALLLFALRRKFMR